jgi:two-component system invasion response regulator UvrY
MALAAHRGFEVAATAETGEQGVEVVDEVHPDVVVLDLTMPGRGGQWAAGEMLRRRPDLPILVLSAHVGRSLERELLEEGVHAVLRKGGSIVELVGAISEATRPG